MSTKIPFGGKPEPEDPSRSSFKPAPKNGADDLLGVSRQVEPSAAPASNQSVATGGSSVKSYGQDDLPPGVTKTEGGFAHEVAPFTFGVSVNAQEAWDLDGWISANADGTFAIEGSEGRLTGEVSHLRFTKVDEDSGDIAVNGATLTASAPLDETARIQVAQGLCLKAQDAAPGHEMFEFFDAGMNPVPAVGAPSAVEEAVKANPLGAACEALQVALARYDRMGAWELPEDDPLFVEASLVSSTLTGLKSFLEKQAADAPAVQRADEIRNQLADLAVAVAEPQNLTKPFLTKVSGEILALAREYRSIKNLLKPDSPLSLSERRWAVYQSQHRDGDAPEDIFSRLSACGMSDGEIILTILRDDQRDHVRTYALSRVFEPGEEGPSLDERLKTFSYLVKSGVSPESVLASATPGGAAEIGRNFEAIHASLQRETSGTDGLPFALDRLGADTRYRVYNHAYLDQIGLGAGHTDADTRAQERLAHMGLGSI